MLESKLRSAFYRDTYTDNVFQLKISQGNYVTVVLLNHIPYVTVLGLLQPLQNVKSLFLA